jgi:hypothetical protein
MKSAQLQPTGSGDGTLRGQACTHCLFGLVKQRSLSGLLLLPIPPFTFDFGTGFGEKVTGRAAGR